MVSARTIVTALRTNGNQRYSWMKNRRSLFVSRTRPLNLAPQHSQLMAERGILRFKSAFG